MNPESFFVTFGVTSKLINSIFVLFLLILLKLYRYTIGYRKRNHEVISKIKYWDGYIALHPNILFVHHLFNKIISNNFFSIFNSRAIIQECSTFKHISQISRCDRLLIHIREKLIDMVILSLR